MQRKARSMAIETDKKSAASAASNATENVNAAEKNVDSSIKKDAPIN
jgi:hypothetical protein